MLTIQLDKHSAVPFYRQIVDLVLAGISTGRIEPGDRLPTIRELAVQLGVNPNTVVKAYSQLQMLGALDTQQGSGVYVRPPAQQALREQDRQRAVEALCLDFVGRAQLLGATVEDLLTCLRHLKTGQNKERHA